MSSSVSLFHNVGIGIESRSNFDAPRAVRQDASAMFGELGGGSLCMKPNRKQRADGRYTSIGDGLESSIRCDIYFPL
jgi:hypothetical protein